MMYANHIFTIGLFVYIPNNGTAFVKSIDFESAIDTQRYYYNENGKHIVDGLLLTFDNKTFEDFCKIQDDLIQRENEKAETKPIFFEKVKQFFGICKK